MTLHVQGHRAVKGGCLEGPGGVLAGGWASSETAGNMAWGMEPAMSKATNRTSPWDIS